MEAGTPHARYAVLSDAAGRWEVDFRAVPYDWQHAAQIAEAHGRPDVARALGTGRV
jgi:purine nucleoside permease